MICRCGNAYIVYVRTRAGGVARYGVSVRPRSVRIDDRTWRILESDVIVRPRTRGTCHTVYVLAGIVGRTANAVHVRARAARIADVSVSAPFGHDDLMRVRRVLAGLGTGKRPVKIDARPIIQTARKMGTMVRDDNMRAMYAPGQIRTVRVGTPISPISRRIQHIADINGRIKGGIGRDWMSNAIAFKPACWRSSAGCFFDVADIGRHLPQSKPNECLNGYEQLIMLSFVGRDSRCQLNIQDFIRHRVRPGGGIA